MQTNEGLWVYQKVFDKNSCFVKMSPLEQGEAKNQIPQIPSTWFVHGPYPFLMKDLLSNPKLHKACQST